MGEPKESFERRERGGFLMEIAEASKTEHKLLSIHWKDINDKVHETWVDIHKNDEGELLAITIGRLEIRAFNLGIIDFLKKKGEI